jgi:hypothetical protein
MFMANFSSFGSVSSFGDRDGKGNKGDGEDAGGSVNLR